MTDAHCHPWDLLGYEKKQEAERRETGTVCIANSWRLEEFLYHKGLAQKAREEGAPELFCSFALHPQLSAVFLKGSDASGRNIRVAQQPAGLSNKSIEHPGETNTVDPVGDNCITGNNEEAHGAVTLGSGIELLASLAAEGRLDAVGETGFDLYGEKFRAAEKIQDEMFAPHLETAVKYSLPLILHVRRGMHKIFPFTKDLKKVPAVIFHSWPGTCGEGESLLRRGINAFFSFSAIVLNNHREAMLSAANLPPDRILLETDAPYQAPRGKSYSSWKDLAAICRGIAALRKEADSPAASPEELEARTTDNFYRAIRANNNLVA